MAGALRDAAQSSGAKAPAKDHSYEIRALKEDHQHLRLLNQALWELLREKLGLTDADLEQKALEIDLRDGVQDGKMTETGLRCPRCGRVSSSKHGRCLYCGVEFEKPIMG